MGLNPTPSGFHARGRKGLASDFVTARIECRSVLEFSKRILAGFGCGAASNLLELVGSSFFNNSFHFRIRQLFVTNFSTFSNPLPIIPTEPHTENIDLGVDTDLPRMRTGRISQ